jgi:hypothetical protein
LTGGYGFVDIAGFGAIAQGVGFFQSTSDLAAVTFIVVDD